jgi:hypothetical protein
MKSIKYFTINLLVLFISSCASLDRGKANAWLNSKGGASTINMTGIWDSGGALTGGWGQGNLIQDGMRFYGTLGAYYVEGIANGENIYMSLSSGSRVYYTAQLKKSSDGSLVGKAVKDILIDNPDAQNATTYLIMLKKISEDQASGKK